MSVEKLNVETCDGWDLVVTLCHWSRKPLIPKAIADKAYLAVYDESDGYGEPGFVPCQGHDWSGIRDSSPEGHKNMIDAARKFLMDRGYEELKYEKVSL